MDQVTGKANVNPLFNTRCTYEIKNLEMLKKRKIQKHKPNNTTTTAKEEINKKVKNNENRNK